MLSTMGAVILAAGFGRLRDGKSKLVEKIGEDALLIHVIRKAFLVGFGKIVVVLNAANQEFCDQIKAEIAGAGFAVDFAYQKGRLGPANAVLESLPILERSGIEHFVVLFGDMPMLDSAKIARLARIHMERSAKITVSSWRYDSRNRFAAKMYNYAYIDRRGYCGHHESTPTVSMYSGMPPDDTDVLSSVYVLKRDWFRDVYEDIRDQPKQDGHEHEKHLPYLIEVAVLSHSRLEIVPEEDPVTILGVNTLADHELLTALV